MDPFYIVKKEVEAQLVSLRSQKIADPDALVHISADLGMYGKLQKIFESHYIISSSIQYHVAKMLHMARLIWTMLYACQIFSNYVAYPIGLGLSTVSS